MQHILNFSNSNFGMTNRYKLHLLFRGGKCQAVPSSGLSCKVPLFPRIRIIVQGSNISAHRVCRANSDLFSHQECRAKFQHLPASGFSCKVSSFLLIRIVVHLVTVVTISSSFASAIPPLLVAVSIFCRFSWPPTCPAIFAPVGT